MKFHRQKENYLKTKPGFPWLDHPKRHTFGLCDRNRSWNLIGGRDCLQPGHGYERDAMGYCVANHPDIGDSAHDHCGFELCWRAGAFAKSDY